MTAKCMPLNGIMKTSASKCIRCKEFVTSVNQRFGLVQNLSNDFISDERLEKLMWLNFNLIAVSQKSQRFIPLQIH